MHYELCIQHYSNLSSQWLDKLEFEDPRRRRSVPEICVLSNFFAIQNGLCQLVAVVTESQQKEGCVLPQQV